MGKRRIVVAVTLLAIAVVALLVAWNFGRGRAPSAGSRLESAVAAGATSFDFAADPSFAWDRMYVFGCYTDRATVEKTLGFAWPGYRWTTIGSSDSVILLVFVRNGQVVGWHEQPLTIELGYLANNTNGYSRAEAVFDIDRSLRTIVLKPRTAATVPATTPVR